MREPRTPPRPSPLVLAVCLLLAGCGLDASFGDLGEKLLDPEVEALDVPGRQLLAGPHYDLSMRQDASGSPYGLARTPERDLVIVDFAGQSYCRAPEVDRYGSPVEKGSRSFITTLHRDAESDALWLGFVDFDCGRPAFRVAVNGLPSARLGGSLEGSLLVFAPDQTTLLQVDPWAEPVTVLAENVSGFTRDRRSGNFVWTEQGALVVMSAELQPLGRVGNDVRWWEHSPSAPEMAYLDGDVLKVAPTSELSEGEVITTGVCQPRFVSLAGRLKLQLLAPCAERRLTFRDRETGEERQLAADVIAGPVVRSIGSEPFVTYVTSEEDPESAGTLWLARGDDPAVRIAGNARVSPGALLPDGALLALVEPTDRGGRLIEWRDGQSTDVAEEVYSIAPLRMSNGDLTLLTGFDGALGNLVRLRADRSLEPLFEGVLPRSIDGNAFVAHHDGDVGDLVLIDPDTGTTEVVASGVLAQSFAFFQQFPGVFVLADRDTETATSTLRLQLIDSGRHHIVHDGVTGALEVPFPAPGLLYNVVTGDDAGIWFARAL
jgi:hypothetical protein